MWTVEDESNQTRGLVKHDDAEGRTYIAANSWFESWQEMQHRAAAEYMAKQIGL
jgi:hypothetical protein